MGTGTFVVVLIVSPRKNHPDARTTTKVPVPFVVVLGWTSYSL